MDVASDTDVTQLLLAWEQGEKAALEKLIPSVYEKLHRIARRCAKHPSIVSRAIGRGLTLGKENRGRMSLLDLHLPILDCADWRLNLEGILAF